MCHFCSAGSTVIYVKCGDVLCFIDALACGADIVVQSSHKTLTALSQAAMMHLGKEAYRFPKESQRGRQDGQIEESEGVDNRTEEAGELLQECFSMLTTTSPNLVFLASLDAARAQMASEGEAMIRSAAEAADEIRYELRQQGLLRTEEGEEEDEVPGGVQLLDDSLSVGAARRHKTCTESESKVVCVISPQWLVDPLRLTVRFPGRSALDVDDEICEGKQRRQDGRIYWRCLLDESHLLSTPYSSSAVVERFLLQ